MIKWNVLIRTVRTTNGKEIYENNEYYSAPLHHPTNIISQRLSSAPRQKAKQNLRRKVFCPYDEVHLLIASIKVGSEIVVSGRERYLSKHLMVVN